MKKLIILFILGFSFTICIHAQMVVSDPNMLAASLQSWGNQLKQAQESFKQMQEQTKFLKDASDALKKINTSISTMRSVKSLVDQQSQLVSFFSSEISRAQNESVNYEATTAYVKRLNRMQERIITNTSYLTQLLSDGIFNLTDGERLRELRTLEQDNSTVLNATMKEKDKFDTMNAQLKEINRLMNK